MAGPGGPGAPPGAGLGCVWGGEGGGGGGGGGGSAAGSPACTCERRKKARDLQQAAGLSNKQTWNQSRPCVVMPASNPFSCAPCSSIVLVSEWEQSQRITVVQASRNTGFAIARPEAFLRA